MRRLKPDSNAKVHVFNKKQKKIEIKQEIFLWGNYDKAFSKHAQSREPYGIAHCRLLHWYEVCLNANHEKK